MRFLRSFVAALLVLFLPTLASAQVMQEFQMLCIDSTTYAPSVYAYNVGQWGTASPCVPPTPFDLIGKPPAGWGATAACTTGGSFDCAVGESFEMVPVSPGQGTVNTSTSGVMSISTTNSFMPGLVLYGFRIPLNVDSGLTNTMRAIHLQLDGGIQLNSVVVGGFAIVDITLIRIDSAGTQTALTSKRVMAENTVAQQTISAYSIDYLDLPPVGSTVSYRAAAVLIANNVPVLTGDNLQGTRTRLNGTQLR